MRDTSSHNYARAFMITVLSLVTWEKDLACDTLFFWESICTFVWVRGNGDALLSLDLRGGIKHFYVHQLLEQRLHKPLNVCNIQITMRCYWLYITPPCTDAHSLMVQAVKYDRGISFVLREDASLPATVRNS